MVAVPIIALMMEAENTSEMSVNFCQTTWSNNLEDSDLHVITFEGCARAIRKEHICVSKGHFVDYSVHGLITRLFNDAVLTE
jgi:hypothetical protein